MLIECNQIPQSKEEIPTPEIAKEFAHLRDIADEIPPIDNDAGIHILIGRDAPELLKVRAFKNGPKGAPWAQKLDLGWTISGQVCLNRVGGPVHIAAHRTTVACIEENSLQRAENPATRPTELSYQVTPCPNHFHIKQRYAECIEEPDDTIYKTTGDDNELGMSVEDRRFLDIMEKGVHKNHHGNWEMPRPFRPDVICMPNNRSQALNRLNGLLRNFKRKPQMEKDYREFLGKIIERGHALPVPVSELYTRSPQSGQVWYLPHFGVYHPRKPGQIRVLFDSSAEFKGTSLNQVLLPGPDLLNSLVGVLFRFRHHEVRLMADVEQMFHSFHVNPKHRDFLRFLWFEDNDPAKSIMEYRMAVHLFGNGPSPAIATFGLRRTADDGEERFGKATRDFIHRNFYVDDRLTSRPTPEEAIELIKSTQAALATANIRLHRSYPTILK